MKTKLMIALAVFVFILINLAISTTFDVKSNLTLQSLENMAKADGEAGDGGKCYYKFEYAYGHFGDYKCGECFEYSNHN